MVWKSLGLVSQCLKKPKAKLCSVFLTNISRFSSKNFSYLKNTEWHRTNLVIDNLNITSTSWEEKAKTKDLQKNSYIPCVSEKFNKKYRWSLQPSTSWVYHKFPAIRWLTLHFRNPFEIKKSIASKTPECELCTGLFRESRAFYALAEASTFWNSWFIAIDWPFTAYLLHAYGANENSGFVGG